MRIETKRLIITEFDLSMAESVYKYSLDKDNRRFVPDEVFETLQDAIEKVKFLMSCYETNREVLAYPILLKCGEYIGYVQLISTEEGWEVGYHIGKQFTRKGYATEALKEFLEYIKSEKDIDKVYAICVAENIASRLVLEKCGFQKVFDGIGKYQGNMVNILKYVFVL